MSKILSKAVNTQLALREIELVEYQLRREFHHKAWQSIREIVASLNTNLMMFRIT